MGAYHTHSWYSFLEGLTDPLALLERAAAGGCAALALTDTNRLCAPAAFVAHALRVGVRPVLGACLRLQRWHCVALAADRTGYHNLCRVLSRLHLADPPRPLPDLLAECADGLHVLADDAVLAERLRDAFGPRLWLEVVRPARSPRHERELLDAGRRLGLRPVASTAAHFAAPDDYHAFRLVTAVRRGTLLDRLPRRLSVTPEHHLVGADELRRRFRDLPEALANAERLAEQLRGDVLPCERVLPPPRLRRTLDQAVYLRRLCERGLRRRDLGDRLPARQRLREEIELIEALGLAGYFLVVRDIARHARRRGHSMALRGSAGNSLVCYLLEITDVDPLRFGLPFERFMHPGRPDLPDVDLDFDWKVRDEVIAHVVQRWGPAHVAQISAHQFLQPRSAFREAAKVHGLSEAQISRLVERLPEGELQIADGRLQVEQCPPGFPLEPERWPRIVADARLLLGRPHHLSVHPGGVVLTPRPVEEYVPLQRAAKGVVITQFDKDGVEDVGLVKIDLLGNRALATVDEALAIVRTPHPQPPLPRGVWGQGGEGGADPDVVALLRRGDTLGVNQLESPAMRHLLVQLRPRGIEDVVQALALIRPAAAEDGAKQRFVRRRRGLEPVPPPHPALGSLLRDTEGLLVFEDDGIALVQALTGLDIPDADRFRKRIAKRRTPEEGELLAAEFRRRCATNGVDRAHADLALQQLARTSRYSFCRSHAVSYGLIAWRAARLKARHPLAFWTAALNNNQGMYPRRVYVEAAKRAGIALRLPCVNRSAATFAVEDDTIRVGLGAIATLPEELCAAVLDERQRHGTYRDLEDFRRRVRPGPETLAVLVRCGALDFTGRPRPALFLEAELRDRDQDATPLFPAPIALFPDWTPPDYDAERRLRDEWELLGFVTGPPLLACFRPRLPAGLATSRDLPGSIGRTVRLAGLTAASRQLRTVKGRVMQFVTLEDEWGLVEVTLFPDAGPPLPHLGLGPYLVTGVVEEQYDVLTVNAHRFEAAEAGGRA